MAQQNTPLRLQEGGYEHTLKAEGRDYGQPIVNVYMSDEYEHNYDFQVRHLVDRMENYGWRDKMRSGGTYLSIRGHEPLDAHNAESIRALTDIMSPTFFEVQASGEHIPDSGIHRMVDVYTVHVDLDETEDAEVMQWLADRGRKTGCTDFIFEVGKEADEERIEALSRQYKMSDYDIYLQPKGDNLEDLSRTMRYCRDMAKRKKWTVTPDIGLLEDLHEQQEEEDVNSTE